MLALIALVDTAPSRKDVVIAEVGAAAAFAGFVLVFLGVLLTTYQTLLGDAKKPKLDGLRWASKATLGVFLIGLASVLVSTAWLIAAGGTTFYVATLCVFGAELVALVWVALYSTLWKLL
jgi:hypothetical protein